MPHKAAIVEEVSMLVTHEPVTSYLPLMVGNNMRIDRLWCTCSVCKNVIPDDHFRGIVDTSTPHVLILRAAGYCVQCNAFTVHNDRYYDDGRILSMNNGRWVESRMKEKKASLVSRIMRVLARA